MKELIQRLRAPSKWVSILEDNAYMHNKAPYEAAHRINVLESGLELIIEKSPDPYAISVAKIVLEGKDLEDENDIQGDAQEGPNSVVSLPEAG